MSKIVVLVRYDHICVDMSLNPNKQAKKTNKQTMKRVQGCTYFRTLKLCVNKAYNTENKLQAFMTTMVKKANNR